MSFGKPTCFQGSHFVCWGEAGVLVGMVRWVCVYECVNEVCMVVTGYIDGCAGVGVGVWGWGCVCE